MGRLRDKLTGNVNTEEAPHYQPVDEGVRERYPEEYEQYPEEYYSPEEYYPPDDRYVERREKNAYAPLAILDEIKERPSKKGVFKTIIQGKPVDLHALESYVLKISPYMMRTILRYRSIRTIEEARNVAGRKPMKFNSKSLILLLLAIGLGVLGIIFIFFMPQIMQMFKGGV